MYRNSMLAKLWTRQIQPLQRVHFITDSLYFPCTFYDLIYRKFRQALTGGKEDPICIADFFGGKLQIAHLTSTFF